MTPQKLFVSYTSRDRAWAHWIGVTLRDNGFSPAVHEWEVGPGENIARWMDESMAACDHLLGVFSDAYVAAQYSSSERWAMYWDDPAGREGFIIPIEVERVTKWPPLTRALKRLSLVGLSETEAEHALLTFLEPPKPPVTRPPYPTSTIAVGSRAIRASSPTLPLDAMLERAEALPVDRPAWPIATPRLLSLPNSECLELIPIPAAPEHGIHSSFLISARPMSAKLASSLLTKSEQHFNGDERAIEISRNAVAAIIEYLATFLHLSRKIIRLPTADELIFAWSAGGSVVAEANIIGTKVGAEPHRANAWGVFVPPTGCSEWIHSADHANVPNVVRLDGSGSATVCRKFWLDPNRGWPYVSFRIAILADPGSIAQN